MPHTQITDLRSTYEVKRPAISDCALASSLLKDYCLMSRRLLLRSSGGERTRVHLNGSTILLVRDFSFMTDGLLRGKSLLARSAETRDGRIRMASDTARQASACAFECRPRCCRSNTRVPPTLPHSHCTQEDLKRTHIP